MLRDLTVVLTVCSLMCCDLPLFCVFFFNDTAPTEIYTLSLHDALPISFSLLRRPALPAGWAVPVHERLQRIAAAYAREDRKSTRLNSSHVEISYAVFCLKKKKKTIEHICLIII